MTTRPVLLLLLTLSVATTTLAQKKESRKDRPKKERQPTDGDLTIDEFGEPVIIVDTVASDKKEEHKKKWKRRVFYDLKTRKGFTKKGNGEMELFYTLKKPQDPDPYLSELRQVYWYHARERKVMSGVIKEKDAPYARLLHGPYKRMRDGEILEEGIYYVGAKHGRWVSYDKDFVLLEKEKYRKGWLRDAKVTFYDAGREKVDEVYPRDETGEMEGKYYKFHENGQVAVRGQYEDGVPVGRWVEYYPFLRRTHKELMYPEDPYPEEAKVEPVLLREYDRSQRVVYDHEQQEAERKKKEEAERKAEWRRRALDGTLDEMENPPENP
ncbi:MAG: hypothetical protein WBA12_14870 [Catalinimonas sp.]